MTTEAKRYKITGKFWTLANARSAMANASKSSAIVLGCDGMYWVCLMAGAHRADQDQYEVIYL